MKVKVKGDGGGDGDDDMRAGIPMERSCNSTVTAIWSEGSAAPSPAFFAVTMSFAPAFQLQVLCMSPTHGCLSLAL